jgi:hypothetical protein
VESVTPEREKLYIGERLERLEDVRGYIDGMDLSGIRDKMTSSGEGGLGWSPEMAEFVETNYRRWLFLRRKHEDVPMPPSVQIDEVWHMHILDTRAYRRDSGRIFGYYLDHNPYFGVGGEEAQKQLDTAAEDTWRHFREEYGEDLMDWDDDA